MTDGHEKRINELENKVSIMENRLERVDSKFDNLIDEIRKNQDSIMEKMDSFSSFKTSSEAKKEQLDSLKGSAVKWVAIIVTIIIAAVGWVDDSESKEMPPAIPNKQEKKKNTEIVIQSDF